MRASRCLWVSGWGSRAVRNGKGSQRKSAAGLSVVGASLGSDLRDADGK